MAWGMISFHQASWWGVEFDELSALMRKEEIGE